MSLEITDLGEFVDETYHTYEASSLYGMLIGRNLPFTNIKTEFVEADVVKKGYLLKRGSWRKSWKRRYFILRSDIRELCYYPSAEQLTLIGSIAIDSSTIVWNVSEKDDPMNRNSFVVRWHAPNGSDKPNREVLLKSDDVLTMNEWLYAISSESCRTEEVKQVDWWNELFGKINTLDSKAIRETIRHRNSSLPRSFIPGQSFMAAYRSVPEIDNDNIIAELEDIDIDKSSTYSKSNPVSWNSSYYNSVNNNLDEGMMEREDVRAEQQAETIIRVTEISSERKGVIQTQSSFFNDQESDSDDENTNKIQKKMDRKTMQQILRQHSGNDIQVDSTTDKNKCGQNDGKLNESINTVDIIGGEPDNEEEFVFQSYEDEDLSLHDDTAFPTPPLLVHAKSDISTDDNPDSDREAKKKYKKSAEERYISGLSGSRSSSRKKKKEKKEKPAGPPPFEHPTASRHELGGGLCGISLCFELNYLLEGHEKLFAVVLVANIALGNSISNGNVTNNFDGSEWTKVCRTEAYKVDYTPESVSQLVPRVTTQFSILQEPLVSEECTHVMIILYKSRSRKAANEEGEGNLALQTPLCRSIIRKEFLLIASQSQRIVKQEMKILEEPSIITPDHIPKAMIGLIILSSTSLSLRRDSLTTNLKIRPYGEVMYNFHSRNEQLLCLEQIYVSRYSVIVASSFLQLILQERTVILERTKKKVKKELATAIDALKKIPSKTALQELDDMLTGGNGMEWGGGSNTIDTVSRAEALQKTKSTLKEIEENMLENYKDCYEHCTRIMIGHSIQGSVIQDDVGGSFLRRSVWKKSPVWQFCSTNLNLNILSWHKFNNSDFHEKDPNSPQTPSNEDVNTIFNVTFGCPCAHYLGLGDGGLRRMMQGLGTSDQIRLKWMMILQSTGGIALDDLVAAVRTSHFEAERLFDSTVDTFNPEGLTNLFNKASKLAMRLDCCCSQTLGFTITLIRTVLLLASQGVTEQKEVLENSLAQSNFLVTIESLLSTQGHEMGMIEDMDAAVLWLSTVTIRLVDSIRKVDSKHDSDTYYQSENNKEKLKRRRKIPSCQVVNNKGINITAGVCDDICIFRDENTKRIIVDMVINSAEIVAVQNALNTINNWGIGVNFDRSKSASRDSSHGDLNSDRGVLRAYSEGIIVNGTSGNTVPSNNTGKISSSKVYAEFGLTGVVFNQGVNEMQTLANMSGGETIRQVEINQSSFRRLLEFVNQKRGVLNTIIQLKSNQKNPPIYHLPLQNETTELDLWSDKLARLDRSISILEKTLQNSFHNPTEKNVGVILKSSTLCRLLGGSIGILCKSGKDRTSMGVTLEQTRILSDTINHLHGIDTCKLMRKYGVRRMNVYANTGQSCYAFNNFQQQLLPKCYRPPGGTYTGNVAT